MEGAEGHEEEDNDPSLKVLIAQRRARPAYARMVSWEFKKDTAQPKKSGRQKKLSTAQEFRDDSEVVTNLSHELENSCLLHGDNTEKVFSSADGEEIESDLLSVSTSDGYYSGLSDSESEFYSAEEILRSESEDESDVYASSVSSGAGEQTKVQDDIMYPRERKRRPSKKQRKKKSRSFKMMYANQVFALSEFDMKSDIIETTTQASERSIFVVKEIPSLTELCIKSLRGISCTEDIPKFLRTQIKDSNVNYSFCKFQLSWLQNVLAVLEPVEYMQGYLWFVHWLDNKEELVITVPVRNIWNSSYYPLYQPRGMYAKSQASSYIPFTYNVEFNNWFKGHYGDTHSRLCQFLLVLATVVDLMMPYTLALGLNKRKPSKSEQEHNAKKLRTAVGRVKHALKSRFPLIIEKYFHLVLPYVLWAHGDITNATEYFSVLARSDTTTAEASKASNKKSDVKVIQKISKAVYLYEIGRMHAQVGETDVAAKFYRLAEESVVQDKIGANVINEVTSQTLMLQANLYDQGQMTTEKARKSANFWKAVVTSPYACADGAARCAAESFLCFHSSCWKGQSTSWIDVAMEKIQVLSVKSPELLYHLSMLYALMGDGENAKKSYRQCAWNSSHDNPIPGSNLARGWTGHPWKPLVDMVSSQGQPESMQVIWRVQLCPLRLNVTHDRLYEADTCSKELMLRLNSDGYLTGDMQSTLPPVQNIQINPYTGNLVFSHQNTHPESWKSPSAEKATFYVPTPMEVYHDEDGVKVEMIQTADYGIVKNRDGDGGCAPYALYLVRTGVKGERTKVNLMKKMKDYIIKTESKIVDETVKESDIQSKCKKLLLYFYNKGLVMDSKWVVAFIQNREKQRKSDEKKNQRRPKKQKQKFCQERMILRLGDSPISFGKTLVLTIETKRLKNIITKTMFIDCSSQESFVNIQLIDITSNLPDLLAYKKFSEFSKYPQLKLGHVNRLENADVVYYHIDERGRNRHVRIYDKTGTVVDNFTPSELGLISTYGDTWWPLIIGSKLFALNAEKQLWSRVSGDNYIMEEIQDIKKLDLFGEVLVAQTTDSVVFVNSRLMKPLNIKVTTNCKKSLCMSVNQEKHEIEGRFTDMSVVGGMKFTKTIDGNEAVCIRAALILDTFVVVLEAAENLAGHSEVSLILTVGLPGYPKEVCFLKEQVGFVVSWSQSTDEANNYREHLFHFDYAGQLLGVLPFLGSGPRSFCSVWLPADEDAQLKYKGYGDAGSYLFLRDGHDGIIESQFHDHDTDSSNLYDHHLQPENCDRRQKQATVGLLHCKRGDSFFKALFTNLNPDEQ